MYLFLPGVQLHQITRAAERIQEHAKNTITHYVMCNLCGKISDESHLRSKAHLQRVAEQAQLDVALGAPMPFRLRSLTPLTLKGLQCGINAQGLTQDRFLAHWGNNVQSLCQFDLDRFKASGSIQLLRHRTLWDDKFRATLFLVSYSGPGKYSNRCAAVPWHMVPKNEQENPGGWRISMPVAASSESLWWPTVHVWLPGDHNTDSEVHWLHTASGEVIVVVCVYQWLLPIPQGWSVQLANWSR
jgi:hypothetical protein